jgi:hypothetical protein
MGRGDLNYDRGQAEESIAKNIGPLRPVFLGQIELRSNRDVR